MSSETQQRARHRRKLSRTQAIVGSLSALGLTGAAVLTTTMMSSANAAAQWPTPDGSEAVSKTIPVEGVRDGGMKRFYGSGDLAGDGQEEGGDPIFELADGATLKNVVIGKPGADGVHCKGSCTLQNVWWEDVGEDAATFRGGESATFTIKGGGAKHAEDKVLQHNGGGKLVVSNFVAEDFKSLYRSCGNCSTQYKRSVVFNGLEVTAPGGRLAGINSNYGDSAALRKVTITGDGGKEIVPCQKFKGNNSGDEPEEAGSDADGTHCNYRPSDITYK
ncbi:pectate lyase [Streptomyces sp. CA-288835]|uniref:pectate lyase n=1 Tax=Streptomyces sp. CA-288835 TaxID=3240069 RepID=UPI003D90DE59